MECPRIEDKRRSFVVFFVLMSMPVAHQIVVARLDRFCESRCIVAVKQSDLAVLEFDLPEAVVTELSFVQDHFSQQCCFEVAVAKHKVGGRPREHRHD